MEEKTIRQVLIDTIQEYASDEYETVSSVFELAKKSDLELALEVADLVRYYHDRDL